MESVYEIGLLLDFYGQMLTERQYEIMDLHFNSDYSLAEIAENLNISRQGVFDNIKRGRASLDELESKLGLVKKFSLQKGKAEEILKCIKSINTGKLDEDDRELLVKIENGLRGIIDSI